MSDSPPFSIHADDITIGEVREQGDEQTPRHSNPIKSDSMII